MRAVSGFSHARKKEELTLPRRFFYAVHASGALHDSFDSEEAAWEWVKQQKVCDDCLQELRDGGTWLEDPDTGDREWYPIEHVMDTLCGTEWVVLTQEEVEAVRETTPEEDDADMLSGFSYRELVDEPGGKDSLARSIGRSLNVLLDLSLGLKALTGCEQIRIRQHYRAECLECGQAVYLAPMKYLEA